MADADHTPHQAHYAAGLLESLADVVETLNNALEDGLIFNFQISQTPDGKFALAALNCTMQMMPKASSPHAA